jgi:hypothetical protein
MMLTGSLLSVTPLIFFFLARSTSMGSGAGIGGMGSGVSGITGNLVLVTGGAGYIGSHCCIDLLQAGYDVVVVSEVNNIKFAQKEREEEIEAEERVQGKQ